MATGTASPYIGDVVRNAFNVAQAVIAFFTPDEYVLVLQPHLETIDSALVMEPPGAGLVAATPA